MKYHKVIYVAVAILFFLCVGEAVVLYQNIPALRIAQSALSEATEARDLAINATQKLTVERDTLKQELAQARNQLANITKIQPLPKKKP
jgi:hypothetical protein